MAIVYTPQYRVHGTSSWTNGTNTGGTATTITGLSTTTNYDFQVVAANTFGSATSAIVSNTTGTPITISSISLSNNSFTGGAVSGTVVGAITVTMNSGSFTGALSLTGTNASSFAISGSNLVTNGVIAGGTYSINIVATEGAAVNSPFTQAESITGTVTINSISLSNRSFTGGAASGTVVGAITVAMSSGSFTGSLSITGTNASSFAISGSNLVTNGVVGNGSFNINLVATEAAATNSPVTQAEAITGTGTVTGNVTANFGSINAAQPVVQATVSGTGTSPYQNGTLYSQMGVSAIQTLWKSLSVGFFRIHGGNNTVAWTATWGSAPAGGNTPAAFYAAANWGATGGFDALFTGIIASFPTLPKIILTGAGYSSGYFIDWTTATGRTQYASSMAAIAQRAVFHGLDITYWEPMNEINTKTNMTATIYGELHVAVAQAVKAYSVANSRPYYNVGGPCMDRVPSAAATYIPGMVTACVNAGVPVDFISYHDYPTGTPSTQGTTWQNYAQVALSRAGDAHTGLTQAQGASSSIPSNIPFGQTEYNMDFAYGANAEPWQRDYHGAVWCALWMYVKLTQQSGVNWFMSSIYEGIDDGDYGIIYNPGSGYTVDPQGRFLSRFTSRMPGSQVTCTLDASFTNCVSLATVNGSNFGLMIINYDWNNTAANNKTIALNGYGGSSVTVWQMSSANTGDGTTTVTTAAALASTGFSFPAISVTIISST